MEPTVKTGVLIVQLGTPDDASPQAVRRFLKEFLGDRRVVDINPVLWFFILNGIILTTRPKKSAELYHRFFSRYGRTLFTYTQSLTEKIQKLNTKPNVHITFGMRYGNPNLTKSLSYLINEKNCQNILIAPLFPQYSDTTTGSVNTAVMKEVQKLKSMPGLRFMPAYATHPGYIKCQVDLINKALAERQHPPEKLVLSYHGIPQRYVTNGDPYADMCLATTKAIKEQLNYPSDNTLHVYQSRFGKEPWLEPYTDETIEELAKSGIKDITVACPAFTIDCLESLDEIGTENRELFYQNGGKRLQLVSCLNDNDSWASTFYEMITTELKGWT